jgi:hypothetical protein
VQRLDLVILVGFYFIVAEAEIYEPVLTTSIKPHFILFLNQFLKPLAKSPHSLSVTHEACHVDWSDAVDVRALVSVLVQQHLHQKWVAMVRSPVQRSHPQLWRDVIYFRTHGYQNFYTLSSLFHNFGRFTVDSFGAVEAPITG